MPQVQTPEIIDHSWIKYWTRWSWSMFRKMWRVFVLGSVLFFLPHNNIIQTEMISRLVPLSKSLVQFSSAFKRLFFFFLPMALQEMWESDICTCVMGKKQSGGNRLVHIILSGSGTPAQIFNKQLLFLTSFHKFIFEAYCIYKNLILFLKTHWDHLLINYALGYEYYTNGLHKLCNSKKW